jgi:hypothetical protein
MEEEEKKKKESSDLEKKEDEDEGNDLDPKKDPPTLPEATVVDLLSGCMEVAEQGGMQGGRGGNLRKPPSSSSSQVAWRSWMEGEREGEEEGSDGWGWMLWLLPSSSVAWRSLRGRREREGARGDGKRCNNKRMVK